MQDYNNNEMDQEQETEGEQKPHFFCKLTFGQFFTMMVLEIITLCFVFYLGARYGNEYLKIDEITEVRKEPVTVVSQIPAEPSGLAEDMELKRLAREALNSDGTLKDRVKEILDREQGVANSAGQVPTAQAEQSPEPAATTVPEAQEVQEAETTPQEAPPPEEQGETASAKRFAVQVGSYPDVKEASYRVEEWKAKGYPAYMTTADLGDKGQWYRVRLGPFAAKEDASKYLEQLTEKEGIEDAIVVKNEQ